MPTGIISDWIQWCRTMSTDRSTDVRVERSAVLAVERSLLNVRDWVVAHPVSDFGTDLIAFRSDPFRAAPIQVKGARSGLTVHRRYAQTAMIVAYVLDPFDDAPLVSVMTGADAWQLPDEYIALGGRASDHRSTNVSYRWSSVPTLLRGMLVERAASESRWEQLFDQVLADAR